MDVPFEMEELDVTLVAGGLPLRVLELKIEEAMSSVGRVKAMVASPTDVDFEPLLDQDAALTVLNGLVPMRTFQLRLATAEFIGFIEQTIRYELELFHPLQFLSFRKNTRKFRDLTTEKIVDAILDESGVAHTWNTTRPCDSRPYTVQYRETDLDFVKRLLEHEGIYYTFDDEGVMQLGDASGSLPDLGPYELVETSDAGVSERPGITTIKKGARFGSGAATVNDYNWKTPSTSLLSTRQSDSDAEFETYDYPVGYRDTRQGNVLAQLRMEAHAATKRYVSGKSSVLAFRPGIQFELMHAEAIDFSGQYLLVKLEHTIATRYAKDGKAKYNNQFLATPAATPFRPQVITPRPVITGNHTAMVRGPAGEEIHTDTHGRAKVQFHWDREATGLDDSRWIRTLQETSSSVVLSRVGWEVSVGYVDGDPDRPMGLGRQINGQMVPTYSQPSHKNRMTLKTETYPGKEGFNELRMDDSAGKMFMDWHAQKDWQNHVGNDKTETIANNYTHLVSKAHGRTVEKNQSLDVGSNETKQVGGELSERIMKDRKEKIGGDELINVQQNHTLNVSDNDTEAVSGDRTTFVGSVSIDSPPDPELMATLVPASANGFSDALGDQAVQKVMGSSTAGEYTGSVGSRGFPSPTGAGQTDAAKGGPVDASSAMENVSPSQDRALNPPDGKTSDANNFKGMIQRSVEKLFTKQISGGYMKLAGLQIVHDVGKVIRETVDGNKTTTSLEENITQTIAGEFLRMVDGDVHREAKGRVTASAKTSDITVGQNMELRSEEKIEVRGKEIELVAETSFKLQTGGLIIELTPDTIKVVGDTKLSSADTIVIKGIEGLTS